MNIQEELEKANQFKDKVKNKMKLHWEKNKNKYKVAAGLAAVAGSFGAGLKTSSYMKEKGEEAVKRQRKIDITNTAIKTVLDRHKDD